MSIQAPENLEELLQWRAHHDGQIYAWWAEQRIDNAHCDLRHSELRSRVSSLEKRIILVTLLAATGGATLGQGVGMALKALS